MAELATVLKVHVRTVQTWHKEGLLPINPGDRPLLFLGSAAREFLLKRRDRNRCQLAADEFYCPKCRFARKSTPEAKSAELTQRRIGQSNCQVILNGICQVCGCSLRRFSTTKELENMKLSAKITKAERVLKGEQLGFVFADLERV